MNIPTQIWLCIGLFTYYLILQLYSDFNRYQMRTNTKNRIIERLRSEYKVNIKTFRKSSPLYGFAWFNSIWINESIFKSEKALMFTFYHEYFHLKNKHKSWTLFMRLIISISPLTVYFVTWWVFIIILLLLATISDKISNIFENKANDYAHKMIN